jgi:NAD(P)-dependent dehydrogenase (short-subunit alcohol dehydrogenase family)
MGQLSGKTALVTGGNSGIGLATAQRFAAEGAHVFITGRNQKTLDDAVASIGAEATGIRGDVSNLDDLDNVADAIRARGRGLDVVFANAGGGELATLADVTRRTVR